MSTSLNVDITHNIYVNIEDVDIYMCCLSHLFVIQVNSGSGFTFPSCNQWLNMLTFVSKYIQAFHWLIDLSIVMTPSY